MMGASPARIARPSELHRIPSPGGNEPGRRNSLLTGNFSHFIREFFAGFGAARPFHDRSTCSSRSIFPAPDITGRNQVDLPLWLNSPIYEQYVSALVDTDVGSHGLFPPFLAWHVGTKQKHSRLLKAAIG
jgi:hypothetical protein